MLGALLLIVIIAIAGLSVFAWRVMYAKPGGDAGYGAAMEKLASEYQPSTGESGLGLIELLTEERKRLEAEFLNGDPGNLVDYQSLEPWYEPLTEPVEVAQARVLGVLARYSQSRMPELWTRLVAANRFTRDWPEGPLADALFPDLGHARALARMNGARMLLGAERAPWSEVVKPYEQTLALARLMAQDTTLISRLVAVAIQSKADMDLRHILIERRLSPEVLQELIAIQERQAITTPASLALRGEKLYFADFVQRTHTDNGRGDGRLILTEFDRLTGKNAVDASKRDFDLKIYNLLGHLAASKKETLARGGAYFSMVASLADTPRHARDAADVRAVEILNDQRELRYFVIPVLTPSIYKHMRAEDQSQTEHTGLRVILEIELFRARSARLPTSLDELVKSLSPDAAANLLTDPFTGKRFGYRVLDKPEAPAEGVPFGRDYLVYSFGRDGIDDYGIEADAKAGPFAALHDDDQNGTDLVINRPRPVKKQD